MKTKGCARLKVKAKSKETSVEFQLVEEYKISLKYDGTLGRGLLDELGAVIQIYKRGLTLDFEKEDQLSDKTPRAMKIKGPFHSEIVVVVPTTFEGERFL